MNRREIDRALELFPVEEPVVRIGLSTWGDKTYRGVLYPSDAAPGNFLEYYGQIFSTVELSATFYGMPEARRLAAWRDAVPETFRFVPKVSQSLTHRRGLADAQQGLREFLEHTAILGERRGPLLLQMPPRFAPTPVGYDRLAAALAVLGRQAAVELRHPAWFGTGGWNGDPGWSGSPGSRGNPGWSGRNGGDTNWSGSDGRAPHWSGSDGGHPVRATAAGGVPPAAELLREYGAALVVTDTVGARNVVHTILTAPVLVLRFVAAGNAAVDGARIDQWSRQILDWLGRGLREVYVYVHLEDNRRALKLAERFASSLATAQAIVHYPRPPKPEDLQRPKPSTGGGGDSGDGPDHGQQVGSGRGGVGRDHGPEDGGSNPGQDRAHQDGGSNSEPDRRHNDGGDSHGQLSLF